jgi:hypothetical protein
MVPADDEEIVLEAVEWLRQRLPGRSDAELRSMAGEEIRRLRARAHLERLVRERFAEGP